MNYDKNTQKNSLAALRGETMGFAIMPLGILPDLDFEPAKEDALTLEPLLTPETKTSPKLSVSRWFRLRVHRLRRAVS